MFLSALKDLSITQILENFTAPHEPVNFFAFVDIKMNAHLLS